MNNKINIYLEILKFFKTEFENAEATTFSDFTIKNIRNVVKTLVEKYEDYLDFDGDSDGCYISFNTGNDDENNFCIYHHSAYISEIGTIKSIDFHQCVDWELTLNALNKMIEQVENELNREYKLVNLTPHTVNIGETVLASSGIARMTESQTVISQINGIDIVKKEYVNPVDLPDPVEDTFYIVSMVVAQSLPNRKDLLCPGEQIRDEKGRIIGCKNLCVL